MISPTIVGVLMLGVPAFILAYVTLWWRHRPVFWFALALIAAGVGYLASSGALADIANLILGSAPTTTPVVTPTP